MLKKEKEEALEDGVRFKAMVDVFDEELKGLRDEVKENREKLQAQAEKEKENKNGTNAKRPQSTRTGPT